MDLYPDAGDCNKIDDPFVYSGECSIGINRLIARMVSANNLDRFIQTGECYTGYGDPLPFNSNCTPPYNYCYSGGCDTAYCKAIESFISLKASFLSRAFNLWGDEWSFHNGNPLDPTPGKSYVAAEQIIIDINASFDCAGLPRPVIQGSIFEAISTDITLPYIPVNVIVALRSQIVAAVEFSYYFNINTNEAKNNIIFNKSRMLLPIMDNTQWLDLTKIETQLWFYYCAVLQIDLGYTAIHMGQPSSYARYDSPNFAILHNITKIIRDYAKSKSTFVLLNPENGRILSSYKYNGTDSLIFDFDGRAMRPLEVSTEPVFGEPGSNCHGPADPGPFTTSPCDDELYPAVIDPCIIELFGGTGGGISPSGCVYETVPYFIYFDFGSGIARDESIGPCEIDTNDVGQPMSQLTWGYEDTRWFAEQLSDECKLAWFESMYCSVRELLGVNGFVQIPAVLGLGYPDDMRYYSSI